MSATSLVSFFFPDMSLGEDTSKELWSLRPSGVRGRRAGGWILKSQEARDYALPSLSFHCLCSGIFLHTYRGKNDVLFQPFSVFSRMVSRQYGRISERI